jgi:surface antigen
VQPNATESGSSSEEWTVEYRGLVAGFRTLIAFCALVFVAITAMVGADPSSAVADTKCSGTSGPSCAHSQYGYPYPNSTDCNEASGASCTPDTWGFYQGQCVSWVAYRLAQQNGLAFSNSYGGSGTWGSATDWRSHAQALGIPADGTPTVGSIAWYSPGHVAYVEGVNSATSIVISEMNYDYHNGFWVHTASTSSGWPTKFIHIRDLPQLTIKKKGTGSGTVKGSRIKCGSTCSAAYSKGTTVALTASAPAGSVFWSWSGACSGTGKTCTLKMNSSKSVTATFVASYTIKSLANGRYVSAELGYTGGSYGMLRARATSAQGWEKFTIEGNCDSGCAFRSLASRSYVSAELGYTGNSYGELRARSANWKAWETFRIYGSCSSSCAIRSKANGKYVSAEVLDPGGNYARLRARSKSVGGWERYKIVRG